jgi:imidazolonepropionase-like amidohydrolase
MPMAATSTMEAIGLRVRVLTCPSSDEARSVLSRDSANASLVPTNPYLPTRMNRLADGGLMSDFAISGARVFDGEHSLGVVDVQVRDGTITAVGGPLPGDVEVIDGNGATLLPGLIDAHVHASEESLRQALVFGVTTELDLLSMPRVMQPLRRLAAGSRDLADVRSASVGLTPAGGHPHQLLRRAEGDPPWPTATTPDQVSAFVDDRISEGADYLKVLIEDGRTLGCSVPVLDDSLLVAMVRAGHARGKLVLAHALTLEAAAKVTAAGADALAHLFVDAPHTAAVIDQIAQAGLFVIPTLSTLASITGQGAGTALARKPQVRFRVPVPWLENLAADWATQPAGNFEFALVTLAALRQAGVDVLAGTDAAHLEVPGVAHGASLHDELRLLTVAGWTPAQALRAATALPARRFGLADRGRIEPGKRADLLLVGGDPTRTITDTLTIRDVWRQGTRLASGPLATGTTPTPA